MKELIKPIENQTFYDSDTIKGLCSEYYCPSFNLPCPGFSCEPFSCATLTTNNNLNDDEILF